MNTTINYLGFTQYLNDNGMYICPSCEKPYTNEGQGVICTACGDITQVDDEEKNNELVED